MGNSRSIVVVKVFRKFEYPKSMLHKYLFISDAMQKARSDMQTIVNEIVHNDHDMLDANLFQVEAVEEPGYKFRKRQQEMDENGVETVSVNKAAKALVALKMEGKYGPLNHELNPGLYGHEEAVIDAGGRVVRQEAWYMRQDIENEYYQYYDEFREMLRAMK